jgi:glucose/mannose transport system substrate-binding protein
MKGGGTATLGINPFATDQWYSKYQGGRNMSQSRRRMMVILGILTVCLLVLSACGTATAAPKTQVEVFSWWTTGGEAAGLQKLMDQFNAENPKYEVINAAVAGGAGSNAKAVLKTRS